MAGALAGAANAMLGAPALFARAKPRVVVIGGGAAGAIAAKCLAKLSQGAIEVTLVEPAEHYQTCFFSNLYLGGFRSYESLVHSYDRLTSDYGVRLVHRRAIAVDCGKRVVTLSDGARLGYDRLVLSPGIDLQFHSVPGYSEEAAETMPHAWTSGAQMKLLKSMFDAVPDGGVAVIIAPPLPYRCPPGPYERASMMAHGFKTSGRRKCKIIILDAKDSFSQAALFQEGWEKYYGGMIEWLTPAIHGGILSVDPAANSVVTDFETYRAALVNVIPAQKAGRIAAEAGLTDLTGYCPIEAFTMKSRLDPHIYAVGDACVAGDMPKSAVAANSQAKIAALSIHNELMNGKLSPTRFISTCWSLIATDDCIRTEGRYEATAEKIKQVEEFLSEPGETSDRRRENYKQALRWYADITADMFA